MGRPPRITRQQLLETSRRIFSTRGFDGATLADIGAELGVTPAAILRHVDSKQALFAEAMTTGDHIAPPPAVLELLHVDAAADPRVVLRRIAMEVVPFITRIISSRIVVAMRENSRRTSLEFPFDPAGDSPPKAALGLVSSYFARATKAGAMHVRDPHASAILFIGSLQGYILFHEVLKVRPVYPLDAYIDALIDLWTEGAISKPPRGGTKRGASKVQPRKKTDPIDGADRNRDRGGRVRAKAEPAEGARPQRNARSADGTRRVAGRRPRDPRSRG
jgi:AcrR family transcriptional regulator